MEALQGRHLGDTSGVAHLSLSADDSVLAVSRGSSVDLYSVLDLAHAVHAATAPAPLPVASWQLPEGETLTQVRPV